MTVLGKYKVFKRTVKEMYVNSLYSLQSNFTVRHCYKINDIAATVHCMIFARGIDTAICGREGFVSVFGFHDTETGEDYS